VTGPRVFASPHELADAVGVELGPGPWLVVDQSRIDGFADATGDDQWIHVDPERAAAGPFGATVAHGFLTLSLVPLLVRDLFQVDGVGARVNYGLNKVRFPAPVKVGTSVRARARLLAVDPVPGGYQLVLEVVVETDTSDKPACVAETVSRAYLPTPDQPR
jgi:acyl dehydratase